jgi:dihydroceramidase
MQLVDELSMIYTTCLTAYASFSYSRSTPFRIILAISLAALSLFITVYYHYLQNPKFHQNVWALLTSIVIFRAILIMEYTLRPSLRRSEERHRNERKAQRRDLLEEEAQARLNIRDKRILKEMWTLVAFSLSVSLLAFILWRLDSIYCARLKYWRRKMGLPWGLLTEGHGWW